MSEPPGSPEDLFILSLDGDHVPRRIFPTASHANRFGARLSPDGSMIAYTSEESGTREVYLQPYPALNRRIHVSSGGGFRSAWSGDSKTLFYRFQDRLYGADITTSPELAASTPRLLIQRMPETRYDAAPDGTRFLVSQAPGGFVPQTRINVVLNWAREAGLDGPDERR
jgi:Tol biopolymer transport system component